jgi:integrase-like protein
MQNGHVESFNGQLRAECLNASCGVNQVVERKIRAWQQEYNGERPHNSLGGRTANEFAAVLKSSVMTGYKSEAGQGHQVSGKLSFLDELVNNYQGSGKLTEKEEFERCSQRLTGLGRLIQSLETRD